MGAHPFDVAFEPTSPARIKRAELAKATAHVDRMVSSVQLTAGRYAEQTRPVCCQLHTASRFFPIAGRLYPGRDGQAESAWVAGYTVHSEVVFLLSAALPTRVVFAGKVSEGDEIEWP